MSVVSCVVVYVWLGVESRPATAGRPHASLSALCVFIVVVVIVAVAVVIVVVMVVVVCIVVCVWSFGVFAVLLLCLLL